LFAAQVLGTAELLGEESACGLPVSAQIDRLKHALTSGSGDAVSVLAVDLYSLTGADRHAALDAVVAGEPSPFVLLDGRLVCTGGVDIPAVLAALA